MKSNRINYVIVGTFVLAMVIGLIAAIAMLTGQTGATDAYFAIYRNVTGVKFGTQVLYEGYPIGQVETVSPKAAEGGMRFRVDFTVAKDWRIPSDSFAQFASAGLLSAITLNIEAGDSATPLKPGAELKGLESEDIFAVMTSVANDVKDLSQNSLKPLLSQVSRTIGGLNTFMEGEGQVLFKDITAMATDVSERLPRITSKIETFTDKMNASTDELQKLLNPENAKRLQTVINDLGGAAKSFAVLAKDLKGTRGKVDELLVTMNQTATGINATVSDNRLDIDQAVVDARHVVDSLARHIDSLNQNLDGAARNMYEFSRQIRQNPGLLLSGTRSEDKEASR